MGREQMVEKLADAIAAENWDEVCTCEVCALNPARRLLDAILPQVTTVAELEALPEGSITVNDRGQIRRHDGVAFQSDRDWLAAHPLTVVWQPEVKA